MAAALALLLPASALAARAEIRRTAHGIPHIQAKDYRGIGFGYGYAFAQDDICPIAEQYVTVNGERSRYFGPDGSYLLRGNGFESNNLNSDFFWQQVKDSKVIDGLLARKPPFGPKAAIKRGVRGYVAGYNRYLADIGGPQNIPDESCRGKPWVRPISEKDAYLRFYQLTLLASQAVAIDGIAGAQPPTPSLPVPPLSNAETARRLADVFPLDASGSNAVAVGKAGTKDHKHGLLLGNPHFPWLGTERFYQSHLTIPGKVDVQGASLMGVPLILIGHTRNMAWSHTVSTAFRFTPYQLTLVPGSPTTYIYDDKPEQMTSRDVTVQVLQGDGSLKAQTRTLYSTRFGPIITELAGVPLPWTAATAFAMRDANADNFRIFNHFLDVDRAQSAPAVLRILRQYEGIPWVNTIVADRAGRALYADIGSIPHVTNQQASDCNTALGQATFSLLGLPVLDGSRSACQWGTDPDAVEPGLFGPSSLPHLYRPDYVTNSNDSYWLSNPQHPLTGFARIIGDEATERTLRTRIGLKMTQAIVDGGGFTRRKMQDMVFSDRQYAGELTRDQLVGMCRDMGMTDPCDALAGWDLHENTGSTGALLFRRFWTRASAASPSPWSHAFDPSDAVNTPNTLDTTNPQVRQALSDAVADLQGASIPFDAPLGQFQFVTRNGTRIPLHGGPGTLGDFNAIKVDWKDGAGPTEPEHGSSYVQVVTWGKSRCPNARTILTYSQSVNPSSRFFSDQTKLYSGKRWVTDRFCKRAVKRGTKTKTVLASGRKTRVLRGRRARR
ncbi:MAG: acyl-homoserine-lactone acylase [Thermoleophilaceae bacterium]|nr:acyl-homoserine-lactone acylase [Thermoleophilaceae bacterium]